jgi:5-formyltetrahydrofolate cyclo-ligase
VSPKEALRATLRERIRGVSAAERREEEARIHAALWSIPEVAGARTLLLYASLPDEVDTAPIAGEARRRGIGTVYPRCLAGGELSLHAVDDPSRLRAGRFGIREPDPTSCGAVDPSAPDAALIPGLGWDRRGRRLGRGAGYYDRLLGVPAWRAFRCGLFLAVQEVERIPEDPWDVPLDAVVTGGGVVRPGGA